MARPGPTDVEAAGAAVSALVVFWRMAISPFTRVSRQRRERERTMLLWFSGEKSVDGVRPTLIPAPVQLAQVQRDIAEIKGSVSELLTRVPPRSA